MILEFVCFSLFLPVCWFKLNQERPVAGGIAHLELSVQETEGNRSEEEDEMEELTFASVHAPVITLGTQAAG